MGSINGGASSSKPPLVNPKIPENPRKARFSTEESSSVKMAASSATPLSLNGSNEDSVLGQSEFLTREEVLRRRLRRLKKLKKYYRDQHWGLMEEIRARYREYYWKFGKSPYEEENGGNNEENGRLGLGFGEGENGGGNENRCQISRCGFVGCKSKAMALTKYCHAHILSDSKQILYKACSFVIKSVQSGPIICGKPILRAAVPSLCPVHFRKGQKQLSLALKKAGLNTSSSSQSAPKFHIIVAEYVREIQSKRREARRVAAENTESQRVTVKDTVNGIDIVI